MATASCGMRERVSEEEELDEFDNSEEIGGSDGMTDGVFVEKQLQWMWESNDGVVFEYHNHRNFEEQY